jgi:hypothetical protein
MGLTSVAKHSEGDLSGGKREAGLIFDEQPQTITSVPAVKLFD